MFAYKILGILLMGSPITIITPELYFPYSFLGLTLVLFTVIFSSHIFPIIDCLFWGFCILSIISYKPLSYQIFTSFFICYQYFLIIIRFSPKIGSFWVGLGLILCVSSLGMPFMQIFSVLLLVVILVVFNRRMPSKIPIHQEHIFETPPQDHQNIIIPLEEKPQEQESDYVIPH